MRIAYVTLNDATDLHAWSGSSFHIAAALKRADFEVERIGPLHQRFVGLLWVKQKIYEKLGSRLFVRDRSPLALNHYARQVEKALLKMDVDIILSPHTAAFARLRTHLPIVLWADATFAGLIDLPSKMKVCGESIRHGHQMENAALAKCRLAVYSSEWAAESALDNYDVDTQKVKFVPFGANIDRNPSRVDIEEILNTKDGDTCRLLFVGVNWHRKGGDIAVATALLLNQLGVKTELDIVGCKPPGEVPACVNLHGFLSKKSGAGSKLLDNLYKRSHFFILPTRADCCPIVFAEASSYGLPSVATDVGGTASAIKDDKNGKLLAPELGAEHYAAYLQRTIASRERYRALCLSSYEEYANRINWETSGNRVRELIYEACQ